MVRRRRRFLSNFPFNVTTNLVARDRVLFYNYTNFIIFEDKWLF